ncbi:hypothetical protein M6D81_18895 [Paenibacillus sp. J5C_2022]|uniref:hypothetical protein n=1 Tax=Paenibacillus sp. J5C2022 TaxID=2977129 RepID=UPI0021D338C2|nr:hypothetical protein [Paenibacillus sp. J5C2022]MCU6710763.1 hypothetical protein [Paenibacillus sp. J5C2022]
MYRIANSIELPALLALLAVSLYTAYLSSRLILSGSERTLHSHVRRLKCWSILFALMSAGYVVCNLALTARVPSPAHMTALLLRTASVLSGLSWIWLMALPRVRLLAMRTQGGRAVAPDLPRMRHASSPALVTPYKFAMLAIGTALVLLLPFDGPYSWFSMSLYVTLLWFLGGILWLMQSNRCALAASSAAAAAEGSSPFPNDPLFQFVSIGEDD